jgi:hypothetical protein
MTAVLLQTAQHRPVLAPNQNIENNPMQSKQGVVGMGVLSAKTL